VNNLLFFLSVHFLFFAFRVLLSGFIKQFYDPVPQLIDPGSQSAGHCGNKDPDDDDTRYDSRNLTYAEITPFIHG